MRIVLLLSPALVLLFVAACGGSASETPWPVEPEGLHAAPSAESLTPPSITEVDAGKPKRP